MSAVKAAALRGRRRPLTLPVVCDQCGSTAVLSGFARYAAVYRGYWYCSPPCSKAGKSAKIRQAKAVTDTMACYVCGVVVPLAGMTTTVRHRARKTGRAYCSRTCRDIGWRKTHSESLTGFKHSAEARTKMSAARRGRSHAGAKFSAEARARMRAAKRGWKPVGMHGRPSPAEALLLSHLPGWHLHYQVDRYAVDLANLDERIVIEVDGVAHTRVGATAQRERDRRRDQALRLRGWTVHRVTNEEVLHDVAAVIQRLQLRRQI